MSAGHALTPTGASGPGSDAGDGNARHGPGEDTPNPFARWAGDAEARSTLDEAQRLAAIAERVQPCAMPDVVGDELCPCGCGERWPCAKTEAAWLARGLDPEGEAHRQVETAVAHQLGVMTPAEAAAYMEQHPEFARRVAARARELAEQYGLLPSGGSTRVARAFPGAGGGGPVAAGGEAVGAAPAPGAQTRRSR